MPTQPIKSMTPETDAQGSVWVKRGNCNGYDAVSVSFARSLELRLNAALAENEELYAFINREMKMTGNDPRIEQLKQAIDSAIKSTDKPNLNQKEKE